LGIFTTAEPIDYQAPDGEGVQVFFVTIGPPSERQTHLHLLAMVSTLALKTDLLDMLRKASSTDEISKAVALAQTQLATERAPSVSD
jgi:mannitol/fructose-specific phosphotransferase system IIA component (Ntr-type)